MIRRDSPLSSLSTLGERAGPAEQEGEAAPSISTDTAILDPADIDHIDSYPLLSPGYGRAGDEVLRQRVRRQMRAEFEIDWCSHD